MADIYAKPLQASYARKIISDVAGIFGAAFDREDIPRNPVPRKLFEGAPRAGRRDATYTPRQLARLIEAMVELRPECVAMIKVQAGLGLRIGELIALRVSDVDKARRTVRIGSQITGTASKTRIDILKTDRSAAMLVATRYVLDAIDEHRRSFPTGIDGSIFTHNRGPWPQGTYRRVFRKALELAELPATLRTHELRSFTGTLMVHPLSIGGEHAADAPEVPPGHRPARLTLRRPA